MGTISNAVVVAALLLAATGVATGVVGMALYLSQRRDRRAGLRVPRHWPLHPRPLANSVEREVWHWLRQVFPDYHVMLKLPFTRFTVAHERAAAKKWFESLRGAYCTYAICDGHGRVIGCIDLLGTRELPPAIRQLKQSLLEHCGIVYLPLMHGDIPHAEELRAAIFDPPAARRPDDASASEQDQFLEARQHLHKILDRNRHSRPEAGTSGYGADAPGQTVYPQLDSFLGTLEDSRRAPLVYGGDGDSDGGGDESGSGGASVNRSA